MTTILLTTLIIAFLVAIIFSPIFIPLLKMLKFGQYIRDEGPKEHQKKSGTPTMGGVIIVLSIVAASLYSGIRYGFLNSHLWLLIFVTLAFGIIGFLDDFIKVVMKRNLGLTSKQKLLGQIIVAVIFYIIIIKNGFSTYVSVPGTDWSINFYWAYFILAIIMLLGTSNGTNLTDGLDGLLSGTAAIAFATFAIIAYDSSQHDVAIFSTAVCGALLGFLVFNAHPAKVFMGDTGSLALGGALAGVAMLTKSEILLVIIGGIFVIETLSVIIQVTYFKATGGRRVFKMSPLHNHYVLSGWKEWRIVTTFWIVGILFAIIGVYLKVWL
ncbi:phospho-N-acetylmuramoyl-pentapeptide-transferase [Pullulanibacillus pueri]|uniref:Phospho-N-acetylmuramoyl-pentapeptide-transferase n=2 Tax=Pullulanibacillus pueri TaxID=1437324 RepID=A0A8J2ZRZ3_9BACL|nr:phospho-N-acetylmuramoyl-pentapeptide-transferase [Pullulanibacillus pueri]MBM7680132.1 phospho-N-acetylmuramoyl-pentapeptide-transferase [Pullulanibacillus pueri]GGH74506.1 phospho-N-acetylmuramoyl-pentapeptide-transferase [Pullulanibacillus pueri]